MMTAKKSTKHVDKYLDPKPEIAPVMYRIPAEVKRALDQAAEDLDLSTNKVALIAFRMFLERHEARKK